LLLLVALTASALILRSPNPVAVIAGSRNRPRIVAEARDQSPWNLGAIDVDRGHPECRRLNRLRGPIDRRVEERAARFSALSARRKQLQSVFDYGIRTRKPSSYPSWNVMLTGRDPGSKLVPDGPPSGAPDMSAISRRLILDWETRVSGARDGPSAGVSRAGSRSRFGRCATASDRRRRRHTEAGR
jgi:hypothetical protein